MISHWEVFDDGPTEPANERLHVTLDRKNVLYISANVQSRLGSPEAVVLMFDRVNSVIGVNPTPPTLPNAFRLKESTRGKHRFINAAPFCRRFGIKIDNTTVLAKPEIDGEGVLLLDLKTTVPARHRLVRRKN